MPRTQWWISSWAKWAQAQGPGGYWGSCGSGEVERVTLYKEGQGFDASLSHMPRAEVSLGKILNPRLPLMAVWVTEKVLQRDVLHKMDVWMAKLSAKRHEWSYKYKTFIIVLSFGIFVCRTKCDFENVAWLCNSFNALWLCMTLPVLKCQNKEYIFYLIYAVQL